MNIEPIHDGLLRVWLTEEELPQWGLGEVPDRRQIRRLVRRAMAAVGQRPGQVTAELIPVMGGGVLLISPRVHWEAGQPAVYCLDAEALLDLWERWPKEKPMPVCALYELGEEYRLAVYPEETLAPQQIHLLLEYGTPLAGGEGAVAHAAEYGTLVAMGNLFTARERRLPER